MPLTCAALVYKENYYYYGNGEQEDKERIEYYKKEILYSDPPSWPSATVLSVLFCIQMACMQNARAS
jgi:hypothetical protein